jgi:6-phosphogluconate dehydrogenase
MVIDALERGIAVPSIAEAVFARNISAVKNLRVELAGVFKEFHGEPPLSLAEFSILLENGLYASILSAYAQGYDLITQASATEKWGVNLAEVTRIWE